MKESNWEKIAYSLSQENKELKEKIERYEKALERIDIHTRTTALKHLNWMAVEVLKH